MEVSWYLRFSKTDQVEILASPGSADSVRYAMDMHPDWTIESREQGPDLLFTFRRREPVYDK